jgi:hypothetical protein
MYAEKTCSAIKVKLETHFHIGQCAGLKLVKRGLEFFTKGPFIINTGGGGWYEMWGGGQTFLSKYFRGGCKNL